MHNDRIGWDRSVGSIRECGSPTIWRKPGSVDTDDASSRGVRHAQDPSPHAQEFRRQIVELARAGHSVEKLAREFKPSVQAIRTWIKQADQEESRAVRRSSLGAVEMTLSVAAREGLA
jgi:transposase